MNAEQESEVLQAVVPIDFTYNYRVGIFLEEFIKGLGKKNILGNKCSDCGKVVVPPRKLCGECNALMDEFVELSQEGTVETYAIGHVKLDKGQVKNLESPVVFALVKLDGADALLPARVEGIDPGKVEKGMRVKAVWKDPTNEYLFDLDHFEPAG